MKGQQQTSEKTRKYEQQNTGHDATCDPRLQYNPTNPTHLSIVCILRLMATIAIVYHRTSHEPNTMDRKNMYIYMSRPSVKLIFYLLLLPKTTATGNVIMYTSNRPLAVCI